MEEREYTHADYRYDRKNLMVANELQEVQER
jgi:hypothetical protein